MTDQNLDTAMMPSSRKEFEHNMHLLKEKLDKGQMHFSTASLRSVKGIKNVRYAPNQRINLHTIDEMARVTANMMTQMSHQQEFELKEKGDE